MKRFKRWISIVLLFILVDCVLFAPTIFNYIKGLNGNFFESNLIIKYDWSDQHIPFYQEFFNLIDSGSISWSWNQFLGINFYASKAYYLTGDPFAWLSYLMYKGLNLCVANSLFAATFIKIAFGGIAMYLYLSKMTKDKFVNFVFASIYMTSGWLTVFIEHPVFLSFYVMCPLILYGTEKVLSERKYGAVMIVSAILLSINYYFVWMFCWFWLIYWCMRYVQLHDYFDVKEFLMHSVKILGSFFVGILLSAFIWLPSLNHLLLSPRLGAEPPIEYPIFWYWKDLIAILRNFFIPLFRFSDYIYLNDWYYFFQIGIYCGSFQLLILPQLFSLNNFDKKTKIAYLCLFICFLLSLISPQIGYLFHFTYSLRYTMLVMLSMVIINAVVLADIKAINKKILIGSSIVVLGVFSIVNFYFPYLLNKLDSSEMKIVMVIFGFIIVYIVLLLFFDFQKVKKLFLLFAFAEVMIMGVISIQNQSRSIMEVQYLVEEEDYKEAIEKLKQVDNSFYRVYLTEYSLNEGTYFGIPTVTTYDSCYQYSLVDFLNYERKYPKVNWHFDFNEYDFISFLNIKYIILDEKNEYNHLWWLSEFGHAIDIGLTSDLIVYQCYEDLHFMNSYQNFIKKSDVDAIAEDVANHYKHEITELYNSTLIVDDELYDDFVIKYENSSKIGYDPILVKNNRLEFKISQSDDIVVLLSMAYDPGWSAYIDGEEIDIFSVQGGFTALELPSGNYKLILTYQVPKLKLGYCSFSIGLFCFLAYLLRQKSITLKKDKIKPF